MIDSIKILEYLRQWSVLVRIIIFAGCIYFGLPQDYFRHPPVAVKTTVKIIELPDFLQLRTLKGVVVVDGRSSREFAIGHIPGAINVPAQEKISADVLTLAKAAPILMIYCSNDLCGDAKQVYNALENAKITRLAIYHGGFQEWTSCALPITK